VDIPANQARQPPSGGGPGFQLDFVLALVRTRLTALDNTPVPGPSAPLSCSSSRVRGLDHGVWPSSSPSVSLDVWPMSSLLCFSGSSTATGNDADESVTGPWRGGPFSASPGERGRGSAMLRASGLLLRTQYFRKTMHPFPMSQRVRSSCPAMPSRSESKTVCVNAVQSFVSPDKISTTPLYIIKSSR
jgi:hypothetical protein